MANENVIREARRTQYSIGSGYEIPEKEVPFPWVMMIICVLVDVIDIALYFTGVGIPLWGAFTIFIFTPILIWYINSRDKEFTVKGIYTDMKSKQGFSSTKATAREIGSLNKEARALTKAGSIEAAAAKAEEATKLVSKFPKWLRWLAVLSEAIIILELLPINSIMLFMAYRDNKHSVKETKNTMVEMAKNPKFNLSEKVTRVAGSSK